MWEKFLGLGSFFLTQIEKAVWGNFFFLANFSHLKSFLQQRAGCMMLALGYGHSYSRSGRVAAVSVRCRGAERGNALKVALES